MAPAPHSIRPSRFFVLAVSAVAALLAAGCGKDSTTGPDPADGPMSAMIDGVAWSADANLALAQAVPGVPGAYLIQGTQLVGGSDALTLQMLVYNIGGTGTFPLGTGPGVVGGWGSIATAPAGWGTPLSGEAGTLVLTVLTPTRIAGTFEYTADAIVGSATGSRVVSGGEFDLLLGNASDPLTPLPGNAGGFFHATVGGIPYNASAVAVQHISSNLIMTSSTTARTVSIVLSSVTAAGEYPLSSAVPSRTVTVQDSGTSAQWGPGAGMSGSVIVTTLTSERAIGSFDVTLDPLSGTSSQLSLTGAFDLGLP